MGQKRKRDSNNGAIINKVAEISGFSPVYVRKVSTGERVNEDVMELLIMFKKADNQLLARVKELVPFDNKTEVININLEIER